MAVRMKVRPIWAAASRSSDEGGLQHGDWYRLQYPQHTADRQLRELFHHQQLIESIVCFAVDVRQAGSGGHAVSLNS